MPVSREVASVAIKARCSCVILPLRLSRYRLSTTECACLARSWADSSSLEEPLWPRFDLGFRSLSSLGLELDELEFEREVLITGLESNALVQSSISARLASCRHEGSGPHLCGLHSPDCLVNAQERGSF